jgi:hypothetical protein
MGNNITCKGQKLKKYHLFVSYEDLKEIRLNKENLTTNQLFDKYQNCLMLY